jgi:hypothetical protein
MTEISHGHTFITIGKLKTGMAKGTQTLSTSTNRTDEEIQSFQRTVASQQNLPETSVYDNLKKKPNIVLTRLLVQFGQ